MVKLPTTQELPEVIRVHSQKLSPRFRTIQVFPKDLPATLCEDERGEDRPLGLSAAGHSRGEEAHVQHKTA